MNLLLLSKENPELAKAEAEALLGRAEADNHILLTENNELKLMERLAFASKIYKILFASDEKKLEKDMKSFDWNSVYEKSFCLRIEGKLGKKESELADIVWSKLNKPKADLKSAKTKIGIVAGKKIYACLLIHESKKDYLQRKTHLRPEAVPTSMHPKLAKALVNLTGAVKGEITDPFCGSGGILIEAGLMGLKTVGYDIDKRVLAMADRNLGHYKIKKYKLIEADGTKINMAEYVVTDLPYGRNTKITESPENLYLSFLKNLKRTLEKKAVVVFPDFVDYRKLVKKAGLNIEKEFSHYIHKSLTKKIVVLK